MLKRQNLLRGSLRAAHNMLEFREGIGSHWALNAKTGTRHRDG